MGSCCRRSSSASHAGSPSPSVASLKSIASMSLAGSWSSGGFMTRYDNHVAPARTTEIAPGRGRIRGCERSMKRWLMRILAVLSLALLLGSVVLWVRSVRVNDQLTYRADPFVMMLMTAPHGLCLQRGEVPAQRGTRVVISAANLIFPEPGWSFRSLPWGQDTVTSSTGTRGQTSFSLRLSISVNNLWVEPVNSALGFGWETRPRPLVVVVPFWFLVILFSILPFMWMRLAARDRARHAHGLCPHCGYDLR